VHFIFQALKVEEGMGSEGKKKNALSLPKTTGFFERGCALFFLPILRSTLVERQRTVKPPIGVWKS